MGSKKGFISPLDTSVRYVQEFSPWRSPKLMGSAIRIFLTGMVTGVVVFALVLAKTDKAIVNNSDPRVQPTVTVTVKAPERSQR